jgi:beta-phosphoglucomutase family hydrolase
MKELNEKNVASESVADFPFKGVIFDMDGTLLESTEADYRAWEKVFNNYGKQLSFADYQPLLGVRSADVIRKQLGFTDESDVKRILKEKFDCFVDFIDANPIEPVHSAEAFLKSLADYPVSVGLATSSRNEKMKLVLTQLDFLKYFDIVVTGEEVNHGKPAPDIFLVAAERLGLQPADCIVVEDGPVGVSAAKRAGMKCVAITATHSAEQLSEADVIIDTYQHLNLRELAEQLR